MSLAIHTSGAVRATAGWRFRNAELLPPLPPLPRGYGGAARTPGLRCWDGLSLFWCDGGVGGHLGSWVSSSELLAFFGVPLRRIGSARPQGGARLAGSLGIPTFCAENVARRRARRGAFGVATGVSRRREPGGRGRSSLGRSSGGACGRDDRFLASGTCGYSMGPGVQEG